MLLAFVFWLGLFVLIRFWFCLIDRFVVLIWVCRFVCMMMFVLGSWCLLDFAVRDSLFDCVLLVCVCCCFVVGGRAVLWLVV